MCNLDLKTFEINRIALLEKLEEGLIDKTRFLKESMDLFKGEVHSEPEIISSVEQGVFYYYYFNTQAKYYMIKNKNNKDKINAAISKEYYDIKENILIKTLELLDEDQIDAYYVNSDSLKLKHCLVEIVIQNKEKLIFHTIKPSTVAWLKRKRLLKTGIKNSKISSYINTKYY